MKLQIVITKIVDFFYPPFRKIMPLSFFRYGFTGVGNMVFDWVLFWILYNFIFQKNLVDVHFVVLSPHVAALLVVFPITFFSGFLLSKYISFSDSLLKGRIQLFRYLLVVACCLIINYICLKLFVDVCGFYPTPSKMITTVIATIFSYLAQRNYTFQKK